MAQAQVIITQQRLPQIVLEILVLLIIVADPLRPHCSFYAHEEDSLLSARLLRPCRQSSARRTWIFLGLGATAAAVVLCPDAASFSRYVRTRQAGPKGLLSGGLAWLQHRTGLRSSFKRLIVCSVATVGSRTFLGLFGSWVELPELPRSFPSRLQDVLPTNPEGERLVHDDHTHSFLVVVVAENHFSVLPCLMSRNSLQGTLMRLSSRTSPPSSRSRHASKAKMALACCLLRTNRNG